MAKLNQIMRSAYTETFTAIQEHSKRDDGNLNRGIIDLFPTIDMRKKDKRIKAAGSSRKSVKKPLNDY
jgi:hypothetical protein